VCADPFRCCIYITQGDDIAFSAATGSGKTLAYLLPIMQLLKSQEQEGKARQSMRPRALILVPTRELVGQVRGWRRALCMSSVII
jgi:superfamily II DNA/RNA helicase